MYKKTKLGRKKNRHDDKTSSDCYAQESKWRGSASRKKWIESGNE